MDNASNNETFSDELEKRSKDLGIRFSAQSRIRCFAHVINLSVQELLKHLKSQPDFDSWNAYLENTKGYEDAQISTDSNIGNAVAKVMPV